MKFNNDGGRRPLTRAGETRDQEKIAILDSIFLNFG